MPAIGAPHAVEAERPMERQVIELFQREAGAVKVERMQDSKSHRTWRRDEVQDA